jgi:hypothetical protein
MADRSKKKQKAELTTEAPRHRERRERRELF